MKNLLASVRHEGVTDRVDRAVRSLEEEWRRGEPEIARHWAAHDPEETLSVLAALVKADLRCRFARGERPTVRDYLDRFSILHTENDRVLSLIYEEFCLCEEQGDRPEAESFCRRYEPWRDSLASQLKYHQLLSRVVGPSSSPPRFPEPGEHFREFAIDSNLGQGGAARVYRARNDLLGGREVALKVSVDRGQEPSIMGRLDHEHIVPVHNVVIQEETQLRGLIMPYRPGLALDELIRRVNPGSHPRAASVFWRVVRDSTLVNKPTPREVPTEDVPSALDTPVWASFPSRGLYAEGVAWIIAALARALAHAHSREIQHRDIKPANILLSLKNGPQLLDFNLAHDPHAVDQAEAALRGGTLPYMAPEQLEAFMDPARWAAVGPSADLYSLGLVMHELLTGQAPELPDQSLPLPRAIRSMLDRRADFRVSPRRLNPAIPHALEAITIRCLAFSTRDRYPDAQALADDLQHFLARQPLRHAVNRSVLESLSNWNRRNWFLLSLTMVVAGALAYSTLHNYAPVERRREFLAAWAALDEDRPGAATVLLEPLLEEFPKSPPVQFSLAAALHQSNKKNLDRAAALFAATVDPPRALAALVAWARTAPGAVREFERLGLALNEVDPPDPKRPHGYPGLSRSALATAIGLGSTNYEVFALAAHLDEYNRNYDEARNTWSALIALINEQKSQRDRDLLINSYDCYHYRARVSTRYGTEEQARDTTEARHRARLLFGQAIDDLNNRQASVMAHDEHWKHEVDFIRAEAEIGLGELDLDLDRREDARSHHRVARAILDRLAPDHRGLPIFHSTGKKLDALLRKIGRRPSRATPTTLTP